MTEIIQDPTFWVLVAMVVFVAAFARSISKAITAGLDKRADKIRDDLREAEKLREEAQDLLVSYQRKQRDSAKEAEEIIAQAKEEAERIAQQGRERLEAALERREKQALDRIAMAEAAALDDVRNLTVDIAVDATRDVLAAEVKGKKADALVDAAIKELPKKLH